MKYKRSTYSFCSQASNLKSRSEDIMLLQKKMNVVLMIFINNKVQVQKLMEKKNTVKELTLQIPLFQDYCNF